MYDEYDKMDRCNNLGLSDCQGTELDNMQLLQD